MCSFLRLFNLLLYSKFLFSVSWLVLAGIQRARFSASERSSAFVISSFLFSTPVFSCMFLYCLNYPPGGLSTSFLAVSPLLSMMPLWSLEKIRINTIFGTSPFLFVHLLSGYGFVTAINCFPHSLTFTLGSNVSFPSFFVHALCTFKAVHVLASSPTTFLVFLFPGYFHSAYESTRHIFEHHPSYLS